MYLCEVCGTCCGPRKKRLLHVIEREVPMPPPTYNGHGRGKERRAEPAATRREIAQEVPVCPTCSQALLDGWTLHGLRAWYHQQEASVQEVQQEPERAVEVRPYATKPVALGRPATVNS